MAGSGGPWGGGDGPDDDEDVAQEDRRNGGDRRGQRPQMPDVDRLMKKGQEQLRVLMGGGGSGGRNNGGGGGGPGSFINRQTMFFSIIGLLLVWSWMSFYQLKPEERSVELLFGKFTASAKRV